MNPEMPTRARAAQAVVDAYLNKPLVWGERDCGRMAAMVLREMGQKPGLSKFRRYSTPEGALRALKAHGFKDTAEVLDKKYDRIPLAYALVGDIIGGPGEGMTALGIYVGNGKLLGFAEDGICRVGEIKGHDAMICWRAPCRSS